MMALKSFMDVPFGEAGPGENANHPPASTAKAAAYAST